MRADEQVPRGNLATIFATAAVTLALGVTLAGLGGYIAPRPAVPTTEAGPPAPTSGATTAARAGNAGGPAVVLVPVATEAPVEPPNGALPSAMEPAVIAEAELRDDDDRHERRGHGRRHHEYEEERDDD